MSNWERVRLGDVCDYTVSRIDVDVLDVNNYVSTENMLTERGGVQSASSLPSVKSTTAFSHGDVLVSNIRPYFKKIWLADRVGGCSNDVLCFVANEAIEPSYLYYVLSQDAFFDYMMSGAKGSKMPRGDKKQIMTFEIALPGLEEQRRIAGVLSSLDDKIEVNNRINANLEAQAQALFKQWFVDFDFPDHNGNPYRSSGGQMTDSPLGPIPHNWSVGTMEEFCSEITRGNIPKYVENSNMLILNQKVNKGDYLDTQYYKFNDESAAVPDSKIAKRGDVLLNSLGQGTLGRIHLYTDSTTNVIIDQFITTLRASSFSKAVYIALLLKTNEYQNIIFNSITGSTGMWVLTINNIRKISCVIPSEDVFKHAEGIFDAIYKKKQSNINENQRLAQLRDTLLPKLMNNEIKL